MLEKSFGLFFFLKQSKNEKSDERYIYLRITVDGIAKEISLKRLWSLPRWDQPTGRAKGNKEDALKLNAYLDVYRANVYAAKSKLIFADQEISADSLKDFLTGKGEEKRMLLEIFKKHIEEIFELIGKDYAYKTYQKYRTTLGHTQEFIKWKYGTIDLEIKTINYEFVKDLSSWLKIVKKCNHNSTVKYITTLKSILLECIRKKWLKENPFTDFKLAYKEVEIVPLYQNELLAIRNKIFGIDRLNLVRDIFVFSCYTGLAYVDVGNLTSNQIVEGVDGEKWIMTKNRRASACSSFVSSIRNNRKVFSTSKMFKWVFRTSYSDKSKNERLFKGNSRCLWNYEKVNFPFGTPHLCNDGDFKQWSSYRNSIKMLGHKSIKQTQHYAKIVDLKISEDMAVLKQKLAGL